VPELIGHSEEFCDSVVRLAYTTVATVTAPQFPTASQLPGDPKGQDSFPDGIASHRDAMVSMTRILSPPTSVVEGFRRL
jgi:hypothetical protein